MLSMNQTVVLDVERHRAGAGQVVAGGGEVAVEAGVGERVGEAVGAGEAGVGRVGEAAVGVERHAAAGGVDDAGGDDVGLRRRVGADRCAEELGVRAQGDVDGGRTAEDAVRPRSP